MTTFKRHRLYYLFLTSMLLLGIYVFAISASNRILGTFSVVMLAVSYFIIGVVHHVQNHDLSGRIVIEYALIASLGIACIFFTLKVGLGL